MADRVKSMTGIGAGQLESATALSAVAEIGQILGQLAPLRGTLNAIAERICLAMGFLACSVLLPDSQGENMRVEGSYGMAPEYIRSLNEHLSLRGTKGLFSGSRTILAYTQAQTVVTEDVATDPGFQPWRQLARRQGYRSMVAVPLLLRGKPIGVLGCYAGASRHYSAVEIDLLEAVAAQAAIATVLAQQMDEQRCAIHALEEANTSLAQERALLAHTREIDHQLLRVALTDSGPAEIARTLSRLTCNPVRIWDCFQNVIVAVTAAGEPDTSHWRIPPVGGGQAAPRTGPVDLRLPRAGGETSHLVMAPVVVGDTVLAYVGLMEHERPIGELERRALQQAAVVVALNLLKERSIFETETRVQAEFLHDLLHGRFQSDESAVARARMRNLDLTQPHRVLVVDVDGFANLLAEKKLLEAEIARVKGEVLAAVRAAATAEHVGSLLMMVSDRVTVLWSPQWGRPGERRPELALADRIRAAVHRVYPDMTVSIAIGGVAGRPADLQRSYQEALESLALIRRLGRRNWVLAVDDLGMFRNLLFNLKDPSALVADARALLGLTCQKPHQQLLHTLAVYLEERCELEQAAQALFIHPNTLKYRLRRIKELTGLELRQPYDLLQAAMAVATLRLLGEEVAAPALGGA